jgi:hypothetical protein
VCAPIPGAQLFGVIKRASDEVKAAQKGGIP